MVLEAGRVVVVKDAPPAVDINDTSGRGDEQHQCDLDHVTDLNQHGGGHQCQHSSVAVIFGVAKATNVARQGGGGGRGHRGGARVRDPRQTTQLQKKSSDAMSSEEKKTEAFDLGADFPV